MAGGKKDILRSKKTETEDLLVFGYSCKLFKDDEKAQTIDEGQHLIPWMGQESFKIDRYDARGTLSDLTPYEAPPGGYDRFIELTENAKAVELACDEERYRSLHLNEDEDKLYKEEEEKRMESGETYSQVGYQYVENKNVKEEVKEEVEIEDDTPFVPSPVLDIPVNMPLPATVKHNAIIEKTAMFIGAQGAQMEIVLKAKQAGNPMFEFLTFGNALHGYYRLILGYIKSGRYTPHVQTPEVKEDEESYLHPNLGPKPSVELAPSIHSNANLADDSSSVYSELLNKLKKKAMELNEQKKKEEEEERKKQEVKIENIPPGSIPPPDLQLSISKVAFYASKNGRSFEAIIRTKNDPKHNFLDTTHPYHEYYLTKYNYYLSLIDKEKPVAKNSKRESSTKITPICFAIKPKEAPCVREKSALPVEECSDEEGEGNEETPKDEKSVIQEKVVEKETVDEDDDQLDFDLIDDIVKIPNVKNKHMQLERKRKLSEFLKTLNAMSSSGSLVSAEPTPKPSKKRKKSITDIFED